MEHKKDLTPLTVNLWLELLKMLKVTCVISQKEYVRSRN